MSSNHFRSDEEMGPAFDTDAAYDFLYLQNSPLENARLSHWRGEDPAAFWTELEQYQNPDGGWAHGIDPDYTGGRSSIQSTIEVLRIFVAHQQGEAPEVRQTVQFLKQNALGDGTWQELPEVMRDGGPAWYQPARYRVWETACIAGYCLELGYTDFWSPAARYVRNLWPEMPPAESPHPYWAALLLLGRSHAPQRQSDPCRVHQGAQAFYLAGTDRSARFFVGSSKCSRSPMCQRRMS